MRSHTSTGPASPTPPDLCLSGRTPEQPAGRSCEAPDQVRADACAEPAASMPPEASIQAVCATLLCVDDEPHVLASLRRVFGGAGYRVLTAADGAAGLALLESETVDLILSDLRMPVMAGAEFLEAARRLQPAALRLVLTGHGDIAATIAAINRGEIYRYITKPWSEAELLLTVRHALERRALERDYEATITELRHSAEEARRSRQLLDNIVHNLPISVQLKSVSDNHRVVMWNKAAEQMYGRPREEALGRTVQELWPGANGEQMHAADCSAIAEGFQEFADRVIATPHRGDIHVHLRKVPLHDDQGRPTHLLLIADDITARREAEEKLRQSEARFKSLTALSADWYWEQDRDYRGTLRTCPNGNAPELAVGGQFHGQLRWEMKNAAPLSGTWEDHEAVVKAHQSFREFEYSIMTEHGMRYRFVSGEPMFDQDGVFTGYRGIGRDVTAAKQAEAELRRKNAELLEVNAELSQAQQQLLQSEKLASIGQLAAGVAHEINNPIGYVFSNFSTLEKYLKDLFAVLDAYQAAEQAPDPAQRSAEVRRLREDVDFTYLREDIPTLMAESKEGIGRVRKIVQDLKDFSRVDDAQQWHWTDLHRCIESTLNIASNEIKYHAEAVKQYGAIPEVQCLPSQINQVILNLLVNAAHAIAPGRGRITISTGHHAAPEQPDGADTPGGEVWFAVTDTGCGIPEEIRSRIFDPFFTTKPVGRGTGLGLSLSYGIVQKHGGRIEVESTPGQGSTFRVTLPVRQLENPGKAPAA